MLEMRKSNIQYPFATHYDISRAGGTASSLPQQTSKLPLIPTATAPSHSENRLVPVLSGKDGMGAFRTAADLYEGDDRVRILETRLGVTEKSNRALLEEVIRMQGELKLMVRKNEESIKDEQLSRQQIENSIRMVNDLMTKLSIRIKTAEDRIIEEKSALSSLISHTKGVEQAVVAGQHTLSVKKDSQASKIQELTLQLSDMQRSRDQLEKLTFSLTEELRNVRLKFETQAMELSSTVNDLKLRSRRLEEENKVQLDALRKQGDLYSNTETNTTHLRGQVETRLAELRDVIMEMRTRQEQEANERRGLEQQVQQKINMLQENLSEQNRKREEAMHAMDMIQREKEHLSENEKIKLQGRITESVDEVNKRLLTKEIKLREELQDKYKQMERLILQEQQVRQKYETTVREENEKKWQVLKKLSDEELATIRDTFQMERQKNREAIQKLDESIGLIEKQLTEQKKQTDKVVAAEIHSRKQHEKSTNEKLDHLNEKLSVAASSLQTAIGGVTGNFAFHTDKLRNEMKSVLAASEQATTRAVTDLDARVQSLKQKVNGLEQHLDGRISEATAILAQNLREKVESISLWQDVTSQTIRELNQSIQGLPNEIYAIEEKQKQLKSDMDSRLMMESEARIREIESLKHELSQLKNKKAPQGATAEEMQEVQASIRKLAESVQTVKTVIGMKLQAEEKKRETGYEDLQYQINRLKTQLAHSLRLTALSTDLDPAELEQLWQQDLTKTIPLGQGKNVNARNDTAGQPSFSRSRKPAGGPRSKNQEEEQADWDLLSSIAFQSHDPEMDEGQGHEKNDDSNTHEKLKGQVNASDWDDGPNDVTEAEGNGPTNSDHGDNKYAENDEH
ncbi:putative leucine-rich repeat-containing protein DDB_G0290503 isoform X2 [Physella acuta]|uniref:putative leucine-rich repeat-containing protein DDB_G0290503 isoform X2 n=1 Tax=Physella acuta TaxID=109671 RepID=UPI0027DB1642|nr:putative leucine-rich repeat-containing protein DDB_G0290503 isoform X2 [Physella acuta]